MNGPRGRILVTLCAAALVACGQRTTVPVTDGAASEVADEGPGTDALEANGEASTSTCEAHDNGVFLNISTVGPVGGTYEGPAVVERSNALELVLAFPAETEDTSDGGATDGGATDGGGVPAAMLPRHTSMNNGSAKMPVLPLGARVWLQKTPAGDPPAMPAPSSLIVRDKQNGTLLFGAAQDPSATMPSPIPFDNVTPICEHFFDTCPNHTDLLSSIDVHGDTTVTIADGEMKTVPLGGLDYEVGVMARKEISRSQGCDGMTFAEGITLDVRAKALASLAATLPTTKLPACSRGNSEYSVEPHFQFAYVTPGNPSYQPLGDFDGPVYFRARNTGIVGLDCFDFVTSPAAGSSAPVVEFCVSMLQFATPAVGQQMWVTKTSFSQALRSAQNGPVLFAELFPGPLIDAATATSIQQLIGVRAEPRTSCAYAAGGVNLEEWVFATTPPVVVKSETQSVVTIDSRTYDVWAQMDDVMLVGR